MDGDGFCPCSSSSWLCDTLSPALSSSVFRFEDGYGDRDPRAASGK